MLHGVLFFPVTPFTAAGDVNYEALAAHVARGADAGPGALFVACGTGEFHALEVGEYEQIVATALEVVDDRIPVFAGAGGSIAQARQFAAAAHRAGAQGLLLLPPYLVTMPQQGLIDYVTTVTQVSELDVIVYHRGNARFTADSAAVVAQLPTVIGLKDGVGDVELMTRIVSAVRAALASSGKAFQFFNGMPTAEASQPAYRAIGVPLYSSAVFAFAPDIALAFYTALERDDHETVAALLAGFYHPLIRLRDTTPGYAVSLIKAGVSASGIDAGPVRPPLVDAAPEHVAELARITAAGRAVVSEIGQSRR